MCLRNTGTKILKQNASKLGLSLVVQHFRCLGCGSVPGRGSKIPQAARHRQKVKEKN